MKSDACSGMSSDIEDLKSSVSNGKSSIASAITDKGISTSATDTFSVMAANIGSIPSGSNVHTGTVQISSVGNSLQISESYCENIVITLRCARNYGFSSGLISAIYIKDEFNISNGLYASSYTINMYSGTVSFEYYNGTCYISTSGSYVNFQKGFSYDYIVW